MRPAETRGIFFQSFAIIYNNLLRHGLWFLWALYSRAHCIGLHGLVQSELWMITRGLLTWTQNLKGSNNAVQWLITPKTVQGRNLILKRILICNCFCIGLCIGDYVLDYSIGLTMENHLQQNLILEFLRFQKGWSHIQKFSPPGVWALKNYYRFTNQCWIHEYMN